MTNQNLENRNEPMLQFGIKSLIHLTTGVALGALTYSIFDPIKYADPSFLKDSFNSFEIYSAITASSVLTTTLYWFMMSCSPYKQN